VAATNREEERYISLEEARDRVEEIAGPGQGTPAGHIPFTPRAKQVLEGTLPQTPLSGVNPACCVTAVAAFSGLTPGACS
jgi:hypothetical protein